MERKARENLEAAERLLDGDPCTNAAASRAYYAAYHAAWVALTEAGHPVPSTGRGDYFPHKALPAPGRDAGVLTADESDDLAMLESRRVVADYYREDVGLAAAREGLALARGLVVRLLPPE